MKIINGALSIKFVFWRRTRMPRQTNDYLWTWLWSGWSTRSRVGPAWMHAFCQARGRQGDHLWALSSFSLLASIPSLSLFACGILLCYGFPLLLLRCLSPFRGLCLLSPHISSQTILYFQSYIPSLFSSSSSFFYNLYYTIFPDQSKYISRLVYC